DIVMTEIPLSLPVTLGELATNSCNNGQTYLYWYQQKPGQAPQLLIFTVPNRFLGVPEKFSGSASGTDFTLKFSRVEAEDVPVYYCMQATKYPPTVKKPCTKASLL
uniref:Immunoglobulin V-set domain-containing protein n=1 Tax=Loxodonta africana TaxID=9785 RepID=G3UBI4_LOXAF